MPGRPMLQSTVLFACLSVLLVVPAGAHPGMIGAGTSPRSVVLGDLNEDTYLDLISGTSDGMISVHLGRGNRTYDPRVPYVCASTPVNAIAVADLNGDGHLDVVTACAGNNRIGVRLGAGDGSLNPRTDYTVFAPQSIALGDFNSDNVPDLVIVHGAPGTFSMMPGTGSGAFLGESFFGNEAGVDVAVGDVDNDGIPDVVTANSTSGGSVSVFRGIGAANFQPEALYTMPPPRSVTLADFNGDTFLDLAVATSSNTVIVRLNNGNGTFFANVAYATVANPTAVESGDLNGDSRPDLVVTSSSGSLASVLLNSGTGTFVPKVDYPAGVGNYAIAIGNLDVLAPIDLAIVAAGMNSICVLGGNGNGTFEIPGGPVYVFANASGIAFDTNAWLPPRNALSPTDILVFNRGGTVSVSGVTPTNILQAVVSGGTSAEVAGFLASNALTITGGAGTDLAVERSSKLILNSSSAILQINMASGATAEITGDVEIRTGANKLQALDVNGIVFQSTGRAIIGSGSSSTPFGDGTGASGFNSVLFHFGSTYIAQTAVAVFGSGAPSAVVVFWPGSRFRMDVAFTPAASGRTYADFEYNVPGGNTSITGGNPFQVDSLIVTQGTFTVGMTGAVTIRGNIALNACTGTLRLNPVVPATYKLGGGARQTVRLMCGFFQNGLYISPNVTLNIDNPADVMINSYLRSSGSVHFTHGKILAHPIANFPEATYLLQLDSSAVVTGASASTGWVAMSLGRHVPGNGVLRMDVGDANNYLPIDIDFHGVAAPGRVQATTTPFDAYGASGAQLDLAHRVQRTWEFVALNESGSPVPPTFFSNADLTFPFTAADVPAGSDPSQFVVRTRSTSYPWNSTTTGTRTPTSIQITGFFPLGTNGWGFVAGEPITPSLAVSNGAASEGNGPSSGRVQPMQVQSAGSLAFRVRLSQAAIAPVSVDYETVDGTATAADGDYTPTSGTLNFAAGDTALDIVVPFGADATPEFNETFGITLSNATGDVTIDTATATGTIIDDDDLVAPSATVVSPNGGEFVLQNQQVNLQWTASDDFTVTSVDLYIVRGTTAEALEIGYPNTGSYLWSASGTASNKVRFRVVAHDVNHQAIDNSDANWELSASAIGVGDDAPLAFALPAPAPNPAPAGRNRIAFAMPHAANVKLTVHDIQGRTLAKLADGPVPAGRHERTWDATRAAPGIYFVRFSAPGFHAERRLVVIR